MLYKNKKTGVIVDVSSEIVGDGWELQKEEKKEPQKAPKEKKSK